MRSKVLAALLVTGFAFVPVVAAAAPQPYSFSVPLKIDTTGVLASSKQPTFFEVVCNVNGPGNETLGAGSKAMTAPFSGTVTVAVPPTQYWTAHPQLKPAQWKCMLGWANSASDGYSLTPDGVTGYDTNASRWSASGGL